MRQRGRTDANHAAIVDALRKHGASVQSLADVGNGVPDLLVGYRGSNYLIEVKDGEKKPSARRLTPEEHNWHYNWRGLEVAVVESVEDAILVLQCALGERSVGDLL